MLCTGCIRATNLERRQRYNRSPKGLASRDRYRHSPRGKLTRGAYAERTYIPKPPARSFICERCGAPFTASNRANGRTKWCPRCRVAVIREAKQRRQRAQNKTYPYERRCAVELCAAPFIVKDRNDHNQLCVACRKAAKAYNFAVWRKRHRQRLTAA